MKSLVFLDVESTGLNGVWDRVIEIYMLSVDHQGDVEEYHSLINPERPIPNRITEITGITDNDLIDAPTEVEVATGIRSFIGDGLLVAHNLSFDRRFLESMFQRNACPPLTAGGIDTLAISRQLFPKLCIYPQGGGSHKLKNLMYHFMLDKQFANSHRAKDDVMLLVQVYRKLQDYAHGTLPTTYPRALTHGCPSCGTTMHLVDTRDKRELVCGSRSQCQYRLVV